MLQKYGFTDLYSSSFYDFETEEEKWAYFAKHIYFACTGMEGTKLYKNIYEAIKDKEYFVITTNVDDQFYKSGFDKNKIFRVQGSYRYIQCSKACHDKLYDDTEMVKDMIKATDKELKIPSSLVPICPVCFEYMEPNLRKDEYFVEDENWHKQSMAYRDFLERNKDKKLLLLEFGVGFNTPGIIRYPFEKLTKVHEKWKLVRFNKELKCFADLKDRFVGITQDLNSIFR